MKAAGVPVDTDLIESLSERVCDLVVAEAKNWEADLIVIGTHGRRGVGRVIMGSVPETLGHLHYWAVELTRAASKQEVLAAFRTSTRIALIRHADGLPALNSVKELMADAGRPRSDLYEVALWEDILQVQGSELFYAYMVDNQAIVIPETIDAVRALTRAQGEASASIAMTDASLGIGGGLF